MLLLVPESLAADCVLSLLAACTAGLLLLLVDADAGLLPLRPPARSVALGADVGLLALAGVVGLQQYNHKTFK